MKKLKKNNNFSTSKFFLCSIIISLILLSITQVIFANKSASFGEKLRATEELVNILDEENKTIKNKIVKLSALSQIEKEAFKIGYSKSTSFVFLSSPFPIAYNNK